MNFDRFSIKRHTHSISDQPIYPPVERREGVNEKMIDEEVYQNLKRDLNNLERFSVNKDGSIQLNGNTYTNHRLTFIKCDDGTFELEISIQYGNCHNYIKAFDKDGNRVPTHSYALDIPIALGKVFKAKIVSTEYTSYGNNQ